MWLFFRSHPNPPCLSQSRVFDVEFGFGCVPVGLWNFTVESGGRGDHVVVDSISVPLRLALGDGGDECELKGDNMPLLADSLAHLLNTKNEHTHGPTPPLIHVDLGAGPDTVTLSLPLTSVALSMGDDHDADRVIVRYSRSALPRPPTLQGSTLAPISTSSTSRAELSELRAEDTLMLKPSN